MRTLPRERVPRSLRLPEAEEETDWLSRLDACPWAYAWAADGETAERGEDMLLGFEGAEERLVEQGRAQVDGGAR